MAKPLRRIHARKKIVACTHCSQWIEVATKAMSIACPKCAKRVVLEDFRIQSHHTVRKLHTCGDVVVEKRGTLSTKVKAANMIVRGNLWGTAEVMDKIEVKKSGHIRGDVRASRLVVEAGARLEGHYEVGLIKLTPPAPGDVANLKRA